MQVWTRQRNTSVCLQPERLSNIFCIDCKQKCPILTPALQQVRHFIWSFPFQQIRSIGAGEECCLWIRPTPSITNLLTLMLKYCLFGVCCGGSRGIKLNIDARPSFDNLWEMRSCEESLLSPLNFSVLLVLKKAAPVIRCAVLETLKEFSEVFRIFVPCDMLKFRTERKETKTNGNHPKTNRINCSQ